MKNLVNLGKLLSSSQLKEISGGGRNPSISTGNDQCTVGQCPDGLVCDITDGRCITPGGGSGGGGGICPENVGMNCNSEF